MDYQTFYSIFLLFLLTINYSLTLPNFDETTNDISKYQLNKDSSEKILTEIDEDYSTWNRQSRSPPPNRSNRNNKSKTKSRFLTYDFLLHQWTLHKMVQQ